MQSRLLPFALGFLSVLLVAGCRMPWDSTPAPIVTRSPVAHPVTKPPVHADRTELQAEALRTVTNYIQALKDDNYTVAYAMLSHDSRQRHPLSQFERLGKQGMPSFDLNSAKATLTGHQAVVSVNFVEDANTAGFHLTRENGRWTVLYRGGSPGMPDPREPSGGT